MPPGGYGSAPKRSRGPLIAGVAALAALVIAAAVTFVVVARGSSSTPPPPPIAAPPSTTTSTTTTTSQTTMPAPTGPPVSGVAAVFPDIATMGPQCGPYTPTGNQYTTSTGARAVAVYYCRYDTTVPGATVYYSQWASPTDALQWYQDTVRAAPAVDTNDQWTLYTVRQGPSHRWQNQSQITTTSIYDGHSYAYDIDTTNAQQNDQVFQAMSFRPINQIAG